MSFQKENRQNEKHRYLRQTIIMTVVMVLMGVGLLLLSDKADSAKAVAGDENGTPFRNFAWLLFIASGVVLTARLIVWGGLSIRWLGRGAGLMLLGIVAATNFDPSVASFERSAFGEQFWGLPITWAAAGIQLLLLGPAFLTLGPSLFSILLTTRRQGSVGREGLLTMVITGRNMPPSLAGDRRRVLVVGSYLVGLFIAWLAYTGWRGI